MKIVSTKCWIHAGLCAVVMATLPLATADASARTVHVARAPQAAAAAASPEICSSPWTASRIYEAGNVASFDGRDYTAAYRSQGNAPATASGEAGSGQPWVAGAACKPAKLGKAALDHDANFSPATLQFLKDNTGLDGEQWDNIMKLVNKPEQDSLDWTRFYGYCEDIGDDRGYTMGIFGATTGGPNDGGPDGPALFKAYDAASGASHPSVQGGLARIGAHGSMQGAILKITDSEKVFCGKVKGLQNDAAWREAMWRTFYSVYIQYSVQQARSRGFGSALTIGSFVDTALNQGADGGSNTLQGLLSRSGNSTDEKTFMTSFYAQRTKVVDTHDFNQPPNGKNRVKQWSTLMNQGITSLKNCDADIVKVTSWTMK
ncbi:chitosanase [Burkholderia gladioli]|uniref:chitosanase n=1 Tax=Burkholderia gladioli TaxID=28095 RepID=UPI0026507EF0|nr:chitosanase [Burkholderia gladioli]MDN7804101.1 chitosanase [Burkholderia gladioli]